MIRLTRHADYGIVLLTHMVRSESVSVFSARGLAEATGLPQAMVGKILNELARAAILESHRGAQGGYALRDDPSTISVEAIVVALEGPIALTECLEENRTPCEHAEMCCARSSWGIINDAVRTALASITLADLVPPALVPAGQGGGA